MAGALNDPDFLALLSDQALRRIAITGRSDLGMPGYSEPTGRPKGFTPLTLGKSRTSWPSWRVGGKADQSQAGGIEPCRTPAIPRPRPDAARSSSG